MVAPLLALTLLTATAQLAALPAELQPLLRELQARGFRVRLEPPPVRRSYGLFEPKTRTLWVAPLSFELGIGRQTLLHEAVHAVQSCPQGRMTPIGWRFTLPTTVQREVSQLLVNAYRHGNRLLEEEAFGLQAQPNAVPLLLEGLKRRCPLRRKP